MQRMKGWALSLLRYNQVHEAGLAKSHGPRVEKVDSPQAKSLRFSDHHALQAGWQRMGNSINTPCAQCKSSARSCSLLCGRNRVVPRQSPCVPGFRVKYRHGVLRVLFMWILQVSCLPLWRKQCFAHAFINFSLLKNVGSLFMFPTYFAS